MALCAFNLHFFPQRSVSRRIIFQPFQALIGIISPAMTAFIFPEMNAVKFPRNIKMDIVSGSRLSSDRKAQRQTCFPGDPAVPATRGWGTQALSPSSLPGQLWTRPGHPSPVLPAVINLFFLPTLCQAALPACLTPSCQLLTPHSQPQRLPGQPQS